MASVETQLPKQRRVPKLGSAFSLDFRKAIQDPDSEAYGGDGGMVGRFGFCSYFLMTFTIAATFSTISMGVWSEMGCGARCHKALHQGQAYASACIGIGLIALLTLYLLDFFCPQHLPGKYFALWEEDTYLGRGVFTMAICSFLAFSLIIGEAYPTVPIIISMFCSPLCVFLLRAVVKPKDSFVYCDESLQQKGDSSDSVDSVDRFERKMMELRKITGGQQDQKNFYSAVGYAYALSGLLCCVAFVTWASLDSTEFSFDQIEDRQEKELLFIRWSAPLGDATANFMFALLMWLRVILHRTYTGTDDTKNRLMVEAASKNMGKDIMRHRMRAVACAYGAEAPPGATGPRISAESWKEMKLKIEAYLEQQSVSMQKLTNIIKILNATMLVIVGVLFITFQFTATESHFAAFAQGFVGALALIYGISTVVAFSRLWWKLHTWLQDLPLWSAAVELTKKDYSRALAVLLLLPFVPGVLAFSALNQLVRRCRGLPDAGPQIFTRRIRDAIEGTRTWNWIPIVLWCYAWGFLIIIYKATPLFLNVFLAWMSSAMEGFNFFVILAATFGSGMFLFMLPPVPGPPIYLFGGFVISARCPWGFWWGTTICVALCFLLKLTACAVQQKIIGGLMSNSMLVKQACGVHKPLMRAIERVLSKPGMSFGKVMILCGGPDWPTSVLAGILRLSLFQCELGTCPIIVSVATLVLSGSFYLKGAEGEIWMKLGNFMFILTGIVNMVFWAGLAWSIQDEFEKSYHEITAPREEYVDLEWLDYRSACISERCAISWGDVPRVIRSLYAVGALALGLVGHLFLVKSRSCFGVFAIGDDLAAVQWLGEEGLIRPLGVLGLYAAAASFSLLMPYKVWRSWQSRRLASQAAEELAPLEGEWKAKRLQEAREAAAARRRGASQEDDQSAAGEVHDLSNRIAQEVGLPSGKADEDDMSKQSTNGRDEDHPQFMSTTETSTSIGTIPPLQHRGDSGNIVVEL